MDSIKQDIKKVKAKKITDAELEKIIKKYKLKSQKDYYIELLKTYDYLHKK